MSPSGDSGIVIRTSIEGVAVRNLTAGFSFAPVKGFSQITQAMITVVTGYGTINAIPVGLKVVLNSQAPILAPFGLKHIRHNDYPDTNPGRASWIEHTEHGSPGPRGSKWRVFCIRKRGSADCRIHVPGLTCFPDESGTPIPFLLTVCSK